LTRIVESIVEIRLRRGRLAGDGGISRIAYRVSRIAYLAEKSGLEEKGRVVNQKKHNELRGFSTGLLARALQGQPKNVPDTFNYPRFFFFALTTGQERSNIFSIRRETLSGCRRLHCHIVNICHPCCLNNRFLRWSLRLLSIAFRTQNALLLLGRLANLQLLWACQKQP